MYATILKGVHIGNNVIIGANSLVNKNIPDNCVAAGNPCKVIMSLDEYYKKRKSAQLTEAKELAQLYIERYGKEPDEKAFHEFFWLFSDANDKLPECWSSMMKLGENYAYTMERFRENKKQFKNMNDFLNKIKMEEALKEVPADALAMGNLDPVSLFKMAGPETMKEATLQLLEATRAYPNFVLSSGCDIPPHTPSVNIDAFYTALEEFNNG